MPAKSKAQLRYLGAIAGGKIKKKGLSRSEAKEFIKGQSSKNLPEHSKKRTK